MTYRKARRNMWNDRKKMSDKEHNGYLFETRRRNRNIA